MTNDPHSPLTTATVAPTPEAKRDALDAIVGEAEAAEYPTAAVFAVRLAVEEALTNAINHGHAELPGEPVELGWRVLPNRIDIEITDHGPGFDTTDSPDPTLEENLEKPTGRGLMLMRSFMTSVEHNPSGNTVKMTYFRPADDA